MSTVNVLPIKKGDQSIFPEDTGSAVKLIQDFLQTLPDVQKYQQFLSDFGKGYSLLDGKHYGFYEVDTRRHIRDYQQKNKNRIVKLGGLTEQEVEVEINQGVISYATVLAIYEDQGKKTDEQKEVPPSAPPQKEGDANQYPIQDPEQAASVPEATFYVKTINQSHRLALRKAPAYVKVSKEADADEDKKGKRVSMMPNGTLLKIIQPHLGFECLWHQVEVVDPDPKWDIVKDLQKKQKLYCFAEFVQPLKKTAPLLPTKCLDCKEIPSGSARTTPFPDWTKLDECEPFYDKDTCKYYITVDSGREEILDAELDSLKKEAMFGGVVALLEFYDKQGGREQANKLIAGQGFSTIEDKDFFLPERPKSTLKFLVGVSGKYFNAVPRNTEFFDGIPTLGGVMPKSWRSAHYVYKDIKKDIELVAKRFEEYDAEIKKFEGEVQDLDLLEEAKRLRQFGSAFDKFLTWNDVVVEKDQSNSFEIGFSGPCFNLIYVLEKRSGAMVPLRVGIECFKKMVPIIYERTMGYLFYLSEISKDVQKQKRRWISFVQDYSCPMPRIVPKDSGRAPAKAREYTKDTIKNTPAKEKEDDKLKQNKRERHEIRKSVLDYVGDPLLSCDNIESVLMKMNSLEDVYREVLNKVNISDLSSFVLSCLASKFSVQELTQTACSIVLSKMPFDKIQQFMDYLPAETLDKVRERASTLQEDPRNTDPEQIFKIAIKEQPKEILCASINKFDPVAVKLLLEKFSPPDVGALKESLRKKFKPPTISISDYLPTEDTMKQVKEGLVSAVKSVMTEVLVGMIKVVFASICKSCSRDLPAPNEEFGQAKIPDFFKADVKPTEALSEALNIFDIPTEAVGVNFDDFLNDLSSILTPSEVCGLLRGPSSDDALTAVRGLLKTKYKDLFVHLSSLDHIRKFFLFLGRNIDLSICDDLDSRLGDVSESLCSEVQALRKDLRTGRISEELLSKQLQAVKEREAELLDMLASLSEGDLFDEKTLAAILGKPGCRSSSAFIPPSMDALNKSVVDTMFDNIGVSFNSDMIEFRDEIVRSSNKSLQGSDQGKNSFKEFVKIEKDIAAQEFDKISPEDGKKYLEAQSFALGLNLSANQKSEILPQVKANLLDGKQIVFNNHTYDFRASLSQEDKALQEYKKKVTEQKAFDAVGSKMQKVVPAETIKIPLQLSTVGSKKTLGVEKDVVGENCEVDESESKFLASVVSIGPEIAEQIKEVLGSDVLLKTISKFSDSDKLNFNVIVNNLRARQIANIQTEVDIAAEVLPAVVKEDSSLKGSPQQVSFAKLMTQKLMVGMSDESKNSHGEKLGVFFRDVQFQEQTAFWLRKFSSAISESKFFNRGHFDQLQLVEPGSKESGACFENGPTEGFLDVEELKRKTLSEMQAVTEACGKFSQYSKEKTDLEKAGSRAAVQALVRLFAVDFSVRCLFAFQKFDLSDVFAKDLIAKFVVSELENFLKSRGPDFYGKFVEATLEYGESRNGVAVNEVDKDTGVAQKLDTVSFEETLLYLTRNELAAVSGKIQSKIGLGQSVENWLIGQIGNGMNFTDVLDSVPEIIEYRRANSDTRFVLERYIKVCDGANGRIEPLSHLSEDGVLKLNFSGVHEGEQETFSYGLRLNYYFDKAEADLDLKFFPAAAQGARSYLIEETGKESISRRSLLGIIQNKEFSDPTKVATEDKIGIYSIPVVSVEEKIDRALPLGGNLLQDTYAALLLQLQTSIEYKMLFDMIFPMKFFLSVTTLFENLLVSLSVENSDVVFHDTKTQIGNLLEILDPGSEPWWSKDTPGVQDRGGNEGLFKDHMNNITASGPASYLRKMALMTVPIIIKGLAERFDPCYQLMKRLDENGLLLAGLNWGSVPQMGPVNLFFGFGWGPPLLQYGMLALSLGLLPGEQKNKEKRELVLSDEKTDEEKCKEKG